MSPMSKPRSVMKTAKLRKMRRTLLLVAPSALSRPIVWVRSSTRMSKPLTIVKPEMQSMMTRITTMLKSSRLSHEKICA